MFQFLILLIKMENMSLYIPLQIMKVWAIS